MPIDKAFIQDRKPRDCHACGGQSTWGAVKKFGGRFCSDKCERKHAADHDDIRTQLREFGFVQSPEIPNIWEKGGVAVTEQECYFAGIDEALKKHQHVIANPDIPFPRRKRK
jgi:hypothetical protein